VLLGDLCKVDVAVRPQTLSNNILALEEFLLLTDETGVGTGHFEEVFNFFLAFLDLSQLGKVLSSQIL
jgi:hypothetical protein